jgi:hypothetical protein
MSLCVEQIAASPANRASAFNRLIVNATCAVTYRAAILRDAIHKRLRICFVGLCPGFKMLADYFRVGLVKYPGQGYWLEKRLLAGA